jgi:hypothetical protein
MLSSESHNLFLLRAIPARTIKIIANSIGALFLEFVMLTENYCILWVETQKYAVEWNLVTERGRENPLEV